MCMNLNIKDWHLFQIGKIFIIENGKGITVEEIEDNSGDFNAVQSGEENNGVLGKIDLEYCKQMGYTYSLAPCLTVARTGSAGFVSFQRKGCVVGDSAKILLLKYQHPSTELYLFLQTLLLANRFKYDYGRKVKEKTYLQDWIALPMQLNPDKTPFVDSKHIFSDEGYVPDWEFMEKFIRSLHFKKLKTQNLSLSLSLDISKMRHFFLHKLCSITMGNKLDFNKMSFEEPSINFVGRSAFNNGVKTKVDYILNKTPYKAGCVTVALGGSIGSTHIQTEDFYTSQNVSVLEFDSEISVAVKLFISTMLMNECTYKYYPFGRELNKHIRTDFGFYLPIKFDNTGEPVIDLAHRYSDEGYVPDWQFMENYIKSLPYGDKI